jgi:hypothetical protein
MCVKPEVELTILNRVFFSNENWVMIRNEVTGMQSGKILGQKLLDDENLKRFSQAVYEFHNRIDWSYLEPKPSIKLLCEIIKTCFIAADFISRERTETNPFDNIEFLRTLMELYKNNRFTPPEDALCEWWNERSCRLPDVYEFGLDFGSPYLSLWELIRNLGCFIILSHKCL